MESSPLIGSVRGIEIVRSNLDLPHDLAVVDCQLWNLLSHILTIHVHTSYHYYYSDVIPAFLLKYLGTTL